MDKYSLFFSLVNVHNNVLKVSVILIEVSQTHKYMVWNMKALFFLLSSLSPILPLPLAGSSCSFRECPSWPFLPLVTFHMHYSAEWLLFVCLFVFNLVSSPRDLSCCELFLSWASLSYFTITQQMVGMVCLPFCPALCGHVPYIHTCLECCSLALYRTFSGLSAFQDFVEDPWLMTTGGLKYPETLGSLPHLPSFTTDTHYWHIINPFLPLNLGRSWHREWFHGVLPGARVCVSGTPYWLDVHFPAAQSVISDFHWWKWCLQEVDPLKMTVLAWCDNMLSRLFS